MDGRGGQIYHHATPGYFVESRVQFSIGVAASVLLEYEPQDFSVSHLAYVVVTAKMNGVSIGVSKNVIELTPFHPQAVQSDVGTFATYENIPLDVQCSATEYGLIEISLAFKLDVAIEPIPIKQCVYIRIFTLSEYVRISPEAYDAWYFEQYRRMIPNFWQRLRANTFNRLVSLLPSTRVATCTVPHARG